MAFPWAAIGPIIGGVGQLAGGVSGLFGGGGQSSWTGAQNANMMQNWRNDDLAFREREFQFQQEMAKNGIRWRVDDAKAAGLHPLAALGASSGSYSPVSVVSAAPQGQEGYDGGGIGKSLADMGQGLGRAISATQTPEEKKMTALDLIRIEGAHLDNEYKKMLIAAEAKKLTQAGTGPGLPHGAMVNGRGIHEMKPSEVPTPRADQEHMTGGPPQPQATWNRTPTGGVYATPHKDMNLDEWDSPGRLSWSLHNGILPYVSQHYRDAARPPKSELPPGAIAWRLGAPGMGWIPVYNDIPNRDRFGHLGKSHYTFY